MDIYDELTFTHNLIFPIFSFEMCCEAGERLFRPHWHTEMELVMIDDGGCRMTIGSDVCELNSEQAVIIYHGSMHEAIAYDKGCRARAIIFDSKMLVSQGNYALDREYWDALFSRVTMVSNLLTGADARITYLFDEIYSLCRQHPFAYELAVKADLYELCYCLYIQTLERGDSVKPTSALNKTILNHIDESLRIDTAISEMGIDERTLRRLLKEEGLTFSEYVNRFKLNLAADRLCHSRVSVTDLAHELGYTDTSYFDLVFKRYMGRTPYEYRSIMSVEEG